MMQACIDNMGYAKYTVVYKQVEEARKLMCCAFDNAQRITHDEKIFSEIQESEDEKIRNQIINFIEEYGNPIHCEWQKDWIAWLDKQAEQKPANARYEVKVGDSLNVVNRKPFDYEHATITQKDFASKDEPKFHEGDFIVNKEGNVYKVVDVCDVIENEYHLRRLSDNGFVQASVSVVDRQSRLWDITKDAKDGDVLVYNNSSVEIILLFKRWMDGIGEGAYSYAHTFKNEILFNDWSDCDYTTHPATKEQRDLLFAKMRKAGYEWNAEKKELGKIRK